MPTRSRDGAADNETGTRMALANLAQFVEANERSR
jgi:hypothetical protein